MVCRSFVLQCSFQGRLEGVGCRVDGIDAALADPRQLSVALEWDQRVGNRFAVGAGRHFRRAPAGSAAVVMDVAAGRNIVALPRASYDPADCWLGERALLAIGRLGCRPRRRVTDRNPIKHGGAFRK